MGGASWVVAEVVRVDGGNGWARQPTGVEESALVMGLVARGEVVGVGWWGGEGEEWYFGKILKSDVKRVEGSLVASVLTSSHFLFDLDW